MRRGFRDAPVLAAWRSQPLVHPPTEGAAEIFVAGRQGAGPENSAPCSGRGGAARSRCSVRPAREPHRSPATWPADRRRTAWVDSDPWEDRLFYTVIGTCERSRTAR